MNFQLSKLKAYISLKFRGQKKRCMNDNIRWQSVTQEPFEELEQFNEEEVSDDLHEMDESTENSVEEPAILSSTRCQEDPYNCSGIITKKNFLSRPYDNNDAETSSSSAAAAAAAAPAVDGSHSNLGYTDTESNGSAESTGWIYKHTIVHSNDNDPADQKHNIGSFYRTRARMSMIDVDYEGNTKFSRSSKDRMSFQDYSRKNISNPELVAHESYNAFNSACNAFPRINNARLSSQVNLPRRPLSTVQTSFVGSSDRSSSNRSSDYCNDDIDWSWLDEAMKEMNFSIEQAQSAQQRLFRADAECQTVVEEINSCSEAERRRSHEVSCSSSRAVAGCSTNSSHPGNAEMVGGIKTAVDDESDCGPSSSGIQHIQNSRPVSSWLRQSMRRLIHFNLSDPPLSVHRSCEGGQQSGRPSSAPADIAISTPPPPPPPPPSVIDSSPRDICSVSAVIDSTNTGYVSDSGDRQAPPTSRAENDASSSSDCDGRSPLGLWPHSLSSLFALLSCTLGLFNISRFAVLSIHFGGNFIIQFVILSVLVGLPLLTFHSALGQLLGAGPVDMWKISPMFQGISISWMFAQALVGTYSVVGVSWMFVYFRDSFITKQDIYRWAEPFKLYREDAGEIPGQFMNATLGRLDETVPDYLNGVVLQRHNLASSNSTFGNPKFQLTFNLAVMWMIVFVSLSKGLRSYGKVIYVFSIVPILGIFVLSTKLLGLTPMKRGLFPHTSWSDFFFNDKSWISAATEAMLTWNLLGASIMQVTSHNKATKKLWRDILAAFFITIFVLILSAFLANTCHQLLTIRYTYISSSFEGINSYAFLRPVGASLPQNFATPLREMPHASMVAGERVQRPGTTEESGYQVLRLATELMPAMFAFVGPTFLSPFWAVLFYFTLILFGIAQQLAIWHCVITGIMAINAAALKSWETTITFFACATGFVLGLPMTTEQGIHVVYYLDFTVGGSWWILLVTFVELLVVLMVRGRPYSGEYISSALFGQSPSSASAYIAPLLTFTWNVTMPVALLILSIKILKSGDFRDMWEYLGPGRPYWQTWAREISVSLQTFSLLCIPFTGLFQSCRYMSSGPPDVLDRLNNLYRPRVFNDSRPNSGGDSDTRTRTDAENNTDGSTAQQRSAEDPPPKYTPPPSYSTATGARIAKLLRQSLRRSFRRLQNALNVESNEQQQSQNSSGRPPPPDYQSVLVEMGQPGQSRHHHNFTPEVISSGAHAMYSTTASSSGTFRYSRPSTTTSSLASP